MPEARFEALREGSILILESSSVNAAELSKGTVKEMNFQMSVLEPSAIVESIEVGGAGIQVILPNGKKKRIVREDVRRFLGSIEVDDLINLEELDEVIVVNSLFLRFHRALVYSYIGSILIAVNPYQETSIYDASYIRKYQLGDWKQLPPHIFAIAGNSYKNMTSSGQNQCILISGESGAGKTESTKLILQYLVISNGAHGMIEEQVVLSNTVLEAFGNAKTVRNNNSSRFGKFIELRFGSERVVQGAVIHEYLLEKSRIVQQDLNERNYHCFYYLIQGGISSIKEKYRLTKAEDFHYLNQSGCYSIDSISDSTEYERLCNALQGLKFSDLEIENIYQVLAIVLHIGNLEVRAKSENEEASEIANKDVLQFIASLLEVDVAKLELALTTRTSVTRGETFVTAFTIKQAINTREACAKSIYGSLFQWIVRSINSRIECTTFSNYIGILDIFGFEIFEKNSFEQFCIDYANERLHKFFNTCIFEQEQKIYLEEGLSWDKISYEDNQNCLDLLSKKPMGVIHLLNEESNFPKATDKSFLEKIISVHEKNANFVKSKLVVSNFTILHYAGKVTYDVEGFLEKNRDTLSQDLSSLLQNESEFNFISEIFSANKKVLENRNATLSRSISTIKKQTATSTVAEKFEDSLQYLMATLSSCSPSFIRCIKPNSLKSPLVFDIDMVNNQLKYAGVMETIKIRKAGFPIRRSFEAFYKRYYIILPAKSRSGDFGTDAVKIMDFVFPNDPTKWVRGKTKIFMKEGVDMKLEEHREKLVKESLKVLGTWFKTWICRKKFLRTIKLFVDLQAAVRAKKIALKFASFKKSIRIIQRVYRGYRVRKLYRQISYNIQVVSAGIRAFLAMDSAMKFLQRRLHEEALKSGPPQTKIHVAEERATDAGVAAVLQFYDTFEVSRYSGIEVQLSNLIEDDDNGTPFSLDAVDNFGSFVKDYWYNGDERSYSKNPIEKPILARLQQDPSVDLIIAINKCLLGIHGDYKFPKAVSKTCLLYFIITIGTQYSHLVDEIYSQIMKQINCCPFVQDERLTGTIQDVFSTSGDEYLLKCAEDLKPHFKRKNPPDQDELEAILDGSTKEVVIKYGGKGELSNTLNWFPFTQVKDLLSKVLSILQINNNFGFCLSPSSLVNEACNTSPTEFLTDVNIQILNESGGKKGLESLFLLRYFVFPAENLSSVVIDFIYDQIERDLVSFVECPAKADIFAYKSRHLEELDSSVAREQIVKRSLLIPNYFGRTIPIRNFNGSGKSIEELKLRISCMEISFFTSDWSQSISFCNLTKETLVGSGEHRQLELSFEPNGENGIETISFELDSIYQAKEIRDLISQMKKETMQLCNWYQIISDHEGSGDGSVRSSTNDEGKNNSSAIIGELIYEKGDIAYLLQSDADTNWAQAVIPSKRKVGWISLEHMKQIKDKFDLLDEVLINEIIAEVEESKRSLLKSPLASADMAPTLVSEVVAASNSNNSGESKGRVIQKEVERAVAELDIKEEDEEEIMTISSMDEEDANLDLEEQNEASKAEAAELTIKSTSSPTGSKDADRSNVEEVEAKAKKALTDVLKNTSNNNSNSTSNVNSNNASAINRISALLDSMNASGNNNASQANANLLNWEDKKYSFANWAREKFGLKEKRKGLLSAFEVDEAVKITSYVKIPLKTPLLPVLKGEDYNIALDVFVCLMIYMGDIPSKDMNPLDIAMRVSLVGVQNKHLRDEIYCQLMKQLNNNSSSKPANYRKGWELMELFCGTFVPSEEFFPFVMHFLMVTIGGLGNAVSSSPHTPGRLTAPPVTKEIAAIGRKCGAMVKALTISGGSRVTMPSVSEWENIIAHRPQVIEIRFPDKSTKKVEILSTEKVEGLMKILAQKIFASEDDEEGQEIKEYDLVVSFPNHDLLIPEGQFVMDIMNLYSKSLAKSPEELKGFIPLTLKKVVWDPKITAESASSNQLKFMYFQLMDNLVYETLEFLQENIIKILVAQAIEMGISEITWQNVWSLVIPPIYNLILELGETKLVTQCRAHLNDAKTHRPDVTENRRNLVMLLEKSLIYGTCFYRMFNVVSELDQVLPDVLLLGVNGRGVHLIEFTSKKLIRTFPLDELITWRCFFNTFTLSIGSLRKKHQINLKFTTKHGEELCNVINKNYSILVASKK